MRVALVFPNYWPYVRRGAERLIDEYAHYLAATGHEVDIITSKPGRRRVVKQGRVTIYYDPRLAHPIVSRYWPWFRFYSFSLTALPYLLRRPYDVAHVWLYTYGVPVRLAHRFRGTPYLYQLMGDYQIKPGHLHRRLAGYVVRGADRVAALTARSAAHAQSELGIPVAVLPPCVDVNAFVPGPARDLDHPQVLFAADVGAFQKGAYLLLMAWDDIFRACPEARLIFAGSFGQVGPPVFDAPGKVADLVRDPAARAAISFVGEGRVEDLPRRYARAAVTVLPSIGEAFGLVLAESLACGTPVVGNAYGGPGEIISDRRIGRTVPLAGMSALWNRDCARQLAEAVLSTMELARQPGTAERCREHAMRWSRDRVGHQLEELYRGMVAPSFAAPTASRGTAGLVGVHQ